jgi:membrane protein YqaA with SNARE-associated domain
MIEANRKLRGSDMLRALYDWTLRWANSRQAPFALGVVSLVESSVFPIPADVLFIPMCLARPDHAMRYALIATVTSVIGGILGWMIGYYAFDLIARPILEFYGKMEAFQSLKEGTGDAAILVMLVTSGLAHLPPMKVVTILSGAIAFDLKWFIVSAIVARGGRFFLLGWALRRYGEVIVAFIERRLVWVAVGVMALLILAYAATKLI